jgi:hypothetical protein
MGKELFESVFRERPISAIRTVGSDRSGTNQNAAFCGLQSHIILINEVF